MNAASNEIRRPAYIRQVAVTTSFVRPSSMGGTVGVSPGIAVLLRVRRMARRMAAD